MNHMTVMDRTYWDYMTAPEPYKYVCPECGSDQVETREVAGLERAVCYDCFYRDLAGEFLTQTL